MNHNLIEKISQKYIREQVEEEKSKIYFYIYMNYTTTIMSKSGIKWGYIEAEDEKECCIKVFNEMPKLMDYLIKEYKKDQLIQKYIDDSAITDRTHWALPRGCHLTDKEDEYIDELKYQYIKRLMETKGYRRLKYHDMESVLVINKYPGHIL